MTSRLGYASRTLIGPWLIVPALGMEIAIFVMRGMPWRGEGMWTVDWFAIGLFIIGPLCAGATAVDVSRLTRPGNVHLVVSVPRPARVYLRVAAWCAGPVIGLHLLTIAVALLVGQVRQPSAGWWPMLGAVLVQCAAICWFAALGSALGRLTNPLLAGLAGGGAGFVLYYLAGDALTDEPQFRLLALGAATITMIGKAYNPGYLAGQAVVFALTSVLLLLLPVRIRSGHRVPTGSGVLAAATAVAVIVAGMAVFPPKREVDDPRPPEMCVGSAPEICMYPEHRRYVDLVVPQVRVLADAALKAGYPAFVPTRIIEESRTFHPDGPGVRRLWLPAWTYEEGRLSLDDLAYHLLSPSHCKQLSAPVPPPPEFDRRFFSLLATWLSLVGREQGQAPVDYKILRPEEVRQILTEFDHCDLDGRG